MHTEAFYWLAQDAVQSVLQNSSDDLSAQHQLYILVNIFNVCNVVLSVAPSQSLI